MNQYRIEGELGDGTFGSVLRAIHIQTGEMVAIKKMKRKYEDFKECMKLREYKSLNKLKGHANIIKLQELIREKNGTLYFVFEYMERNLYELIQAEQSRTGNGLDEDRAKSVMHQCMSGLAFMHRKGYFHRDIKPENILVTNIKGTKMD